MDIYNFFKNEDKTSANLWKTTNVSIGVPRNKIIEYMVASNNLIMKNSETDSAYLRVDKIITPPKERFESASNYYHLILHEFAHFKSEQLQQNLSYKNAIDNFHLEFKREANTVELVQKYITAEKLLTADKTTFNVITSYLYEEVKCELAAFQTMEHAKMKITELDERHTGTTLAIATKLLKTVGRDLMTELPNENSQIRKELKVLSDSMCKDYDMAKERVLVKEREREK